MFWTSLTHLRALAVVAGLALAAVACSLAGTPPTSLPIPTATLVPPDGSTGPVIINQVVVTPTPPTVVITPPTAPIYVPPATAYIPLTVSLPLNCQVRTDWQPYAVQAGDTLGVLAIARNVALTDLIIGNCLSTPDIINVGQVIYLPGGSVVVTVAPALTAAPGVEPAQIGFVLVEPALTSNGAYMIAPGTITVRAQGVDHATGVTFYLSILDSAAAPTVLGTDTNLTDGATLIWTVPTTPFRANIWATATGAGSITASTDPILVVNNG